MTPESAAIFNKAHKLLIEADMMLNIGLDEAAGRNAYLAGFHAAQAFLLEKSGQSSKTHSGLQTQFANLVKGEPGFDVELRAFLGRTYNLKAIADYETGPGSKVAPAKAAEAIVTARRFVAAIAAMPAGGRGRQTIQYMT